MSLVLPNYGSSSLELSKVDIGQEPIQIEVIIWLFFCMRLNQKEYNNILISCMIQSSKMRGLRSYLFFLRINYKIPP